MCFSCSSTFQTGFGQFNDLQTSHRFQFKLTRFDYQCYGDFVAVTLVNEAGKFELKTMGCLEVIELAKTCLEG